MGLGPVPAVPAQPCAPLPGQAGGPVAKQLGCARKLGWAALPGSCHRDMMDGCRALFCIINNVFGKLKNISAIALNFNLIPSRGLAAAQGSFVHAGNGSLLSSVCTLAGAGSVRPLGQTSLPAGAGTGGGAGVSCRGCSLLEMGCKTAGGRVIFGEPIPGWEMD